MRRRFPALVLLVFVALAFAGCAAPAPGPAEEGSVQTGPTGRLVQAPPVALQVDHLGERALLVTMTNANEAPLEVARDAFTFSDATGAVWAVNASATDAFDDAWPENATIDGNGRTTGRLAFDLESVEPPARLTYDDGATSANWLLYFSQAITIAPRDDTSFGQPIVLPANGTVGFQVSGADAPIDICVIDDEDHKTWHDGQKTDGLACRTGVTNADVAAVVPGGEYNIGMLCTSRESSCTFTLTAVATW